MRRVRARPATAAPGTSTRSTAPTTSSPACPTGAPRSASSTARARCWARSTIPALDQLWVGGRDHPTTLNGVPVERLAQRPLAEVSVATYFHPRHFTDQARLASWQSATAGRGHRADAGLGLDRPGQRGQRPARDLPAGQPAPVGLVSRCRAGPRRRRRGRANCRWGRTSGRSPAMPSPSRTPSARSALGRAFPNCGQRLGRRDLSRAIRRSRYHAPAPSWATPATAVGSPR